MKPHFTLPFFTRLLLIVLITGFSSFSYAQCGLDIFVANDQSGSVNATENIQARDLIVKLGQAVPLGNGNSQSRMAITDWSIGQQQYNFPGAGANYTANQSDIVSYKNAPRVFYEGTNIYGALLNAYNLINQTPVTGRTARKLIVLMTDADPGQVQNNLVNLANQVRTSGIVIAVIAVGNAAIQDILKDDRVASDPSLYFGFSSYADLAANASSVISGLLTNACSTTVLQPGFDLTIQLTSGDCSAGQVNYTVTNKNYLDFNNTLSVSFYDNDPATVSSARLLATDTKPAQVIVGGASQSYTFTDAALQGKAYVYAVVNLSTAGNNAVPLLPYNLAPRLLVTNEQNPFNNRSNRIFFTPCGIPKPRLEVSNKFLGWGCDSTLRYQAMVCNTGDAAANSVIPQLVPGSNNLVLQNVTDNNYPGFTAQYAYPGGNTTSSSYNAYSVGTFPNPTLQDTPISKISIVFYSTSTAFNTTAGYIFPPVSGQGVPYGAQIISARLKFYGLASTRVVGYKTTNAGKWDSTMYPGLARALHATANLANVYANGFGWTDVTAVAQELVNQPGWTTNSAMGFIWHGGRFNNPNTMDNPDPARRPQLEVTYMVSNTIQPGECATYTYVLKDTVGAPATYDASVGVTTSTAGAEIMPNANFTTNGVSGLNGFDGAAAGNTMDDATMPAGGTGCTQTSQRITANVAINPTSSCPGSYVTATITINNPNTQPAPAGVTFYNLMQHLNLTGTGATFAGEPYDMNNGLKLAQPDVMDAAYPAVPNALNGKGGNQSLRILELPAGASTFKIDLAAGAANFNLDYVIDDIPSNYNPGGTTDTARDATGVTVHPAPVVTWSCPSAVTAGSDIMLNATTSNATSVFMQSATAGAITNTGSVAAPSATYTPMASDVANGYAAFSIIALSTQGCDAAYSCQVPITGAAYDFGDAPASYDMNSTVPDIAGSTTTQSGLYLGTIAPGTESSPKSSAQADGDGPEEDGLVNTTPVSSGSTEVYQVRVTNNTASPAYLVGFVDHDGDGSLVDSFDVSKIDTIPANSGEAVYNVTFSKIPATGMPPASFMRLRLSTAADAASNPYGTSPQGEVEDYQVQTLQALPIHLTSFIATVNDCEVTLNWKVESAENFARFIVERSGNGLTYTPAGTLNYLEGKKAYTFNDAPQNGHWFYRLKLVDIDGSHEYSKTTTVQLNCDQGGIKIYPTLTEGPVKIQLPQQYAQARMYVLNNMGQRLNVPGKGSGTVREVDLRSQAAGYYVIQLITATEIKTFKVIKQ